MASLARLYFPEGPALYWRVNPEQVGWNFTVNTSVQNTIGGRVIQVFGATLSNITIAGKIGEDRTKAGGRNDFEHPGVSWKLHQRFVQKIRDMMEHQSRDATEPGKMQMPGRFVYAELDMDFKVYVANLSDPRGGTISHSPDRFSHEYLLDLFVVQDRSTSLVRAGGLGQAYDEAKATAIDDYIERISDGVGWKPTPYNGKIHDYFAGAFPEQQAEGANAGSGGRRPS